MGGTRWTTLCKPGTRKMGAENRSSALLNNGTPQTNTSALSRTQGTQARTTLRLSMAIPGAGRGTGSSESFHLSAGCQNFSNATVAAIEQADATMSTSQGP